MGEFSETHLLVFSNQITDYRFLKQIVELFSSFPSCLAMYHFRSTKLADKFDQIKLKLVSYD